MLADGSLVAGKFHRGVSADVTTVGLDELGLCVRSEEDRSFDGAVLALAEATTPLAFVLRRTGVLAGVLVGLRVVASFAGAILQFGLLRALRSGVVHV